MKRRARLPLPKSVALRSAFAGLLAALILAGCAAPPPKPAPPEPAPAHAPGVLARGQD